MRRLAGLLALVILAAAFHAGYSNTRPEHEADDAARAIACEAFSACRVPSFTLEATPFQRDYNFASERGTATVTCRFAFLVWGRPHCTGELQRRVGPGFAVQRSPHEVPREAPPLLR